MANENKGSQVQRCTQHSLVKVAGTERPDGGYDAACPVCGESVKVTPPKVEQRRDKRPLLTE